MHVNLEKFLEEADVKETLYPGKRVVKPCQQIGEYKNHCVVIDWRTPDTIEIDIRPGLSGKQLAPEVIKKYPVCFQTPTHVKINVVNDNDDDQDDEEEKKGKSSGGSGGKKPANKKLEDVDLIAARFGDSAEGQVPALGEIKEMVVMGLEIAKEAFTNAFSELTRQINHAQIRATDILSKGMDLVTKVAPPSYMEPKGDEKVSYNYDREKNADIGLRMSLG
ncbi:MAG: hypothetical protein ACRBDL_11445 [Alphaproteobacteria bacterium]